MAYAPRQFRLFEEDEFTQLQCEALTYLRQVIRRLPQFNTLTVSDEVLDAFLLDPLLRVPRGCGQPRQFKDICNVNITLIRFAKQDANMFKYAASCELNLRRLRRHFTEIKELYESLLPPPGSSNS